MIEKIEILQYSEGSDLSSHSCEEALRFLCIVSYHHELVVKLGKDRLNSLPETLVCPCAWCPVLLVQPVRDIKGDVCSLKQVQLYGCTQVALFARIAQSRYSHRTSFRYCMSCTLAAVMS